MIKFEEFKKRLAPILQERARERAREVIAKIIQPKSGICDSDTLTSRGCQCGDC